MSGATTDNTDAYLIEILEKAEADLAAAHAEVLRINGKTEAQTAAEWAIVDKLLSAVYKYRHGNGQGSGRLGESARRYEIDVLKSSSNLSLDHKIRI
jgi:hypothetical protein